MNRIVAVVGPTASGKTAFALQLATQALEAPHNYSGVDLISVDSRQVYMGLEILSGADIPENFSLVETQAGRYYKHKSLDITLLGVSIIGLDQEWSVTHFKDFATEIILNSFKNNRLPILVGGTGLYHQHLFNTDSSLYIPPNQDVRRKAANSSVSELSEWLFKIAPETLVDMSDSDVDNPRRLVRAIEKTLWKKRYFVNEVSSEKPASVVPENLLASSEVIVFGLQISLEEIKEKITQRVTERFKQGAINEVKNLLQVCQKNDAPACSTLGVQDISELLLGVTTQEECQKKWALHEFQYAKRQLTWFKKQENIIWLDDLQKKQYTFK